VLKSYRRSTAKYPIWTGRTLSVSVLTKSATALFQRGADGRNTHPQGQPPPDLRYFNQSRK
jgi:hypothetical protein